MMALLMTGFFAILHLGLSAAMLSVWVESFTIAWPVAFCLSLVVSPLAFMIAGRLVGADGPGAQDNANG